MAFDTSQLTDYSWAQIKLAAKHAMLSAAVGGAQLTIGGRTIGRITIEEAKKLYEMADDMEATADTLSPGGVVLGVYGEIR